MSGVKPPGSKIEVKVIERRAADADDDVAEHEHLQPAAVDVLAHGGGGKLIVADGAHHAAPGRMPGALEQHVGDDDQDGDDAEIGRARQHEAEFVGRRHRPGQRRDGERALGQPVGVLQEGLDDLGDAERCDRHVVGAQAERDAPHRPAERTGSGAARRPGEPDRQAEAADEPRLALDQRRRRVERGLDDEVSRRRGHHGQQRAQLLRHADAVCSG